MKSSALLFWVSVITCPLAGLQAERVKLLIQGDTQKILDPNNGQQDNFVPFMAKILTDPVTRDADFIMQMGDIVESDQDNSDRPQQYQVARKGWRLLDGKIPYILNFGNNDAAAEFLTAFPLQDYKVWPSFVDNYDDHKNVAHQFSAGGVDWLVISVRYASGMNERLWAEQLISNNPEKKVIFIKHEVNANNNSYVEMLKKYPNVVFILSGHTLSQQRLLVGDNGNKIGWIRTNHHHANLDSYMRMLLIDTVAGTVSSQYYSPQYEKFWHDPTAPFHDCVRSKPWIYTGFDFGIQPAAIADLGNDAQWLSTEVPCCLMPGEAFEARIRYKNTGRNQWSVHSAYGVGSVNPIGHTLWKSETSQRRVSTSVNAGENYTFTLQCVAPLNPGHYNFQFQMLADNGQVFGERSANRIISVAANQLVDGSFEEVQSDSSAWKLGDGASIADEQVNGGQFALKLTDSSTATTQVLNIQPNMHYRLSFYVKSDEAISGNATVDTNDVFDQELGIQKFRIEPGVASQWTQISGIFYSDTHTRLRLRMFAANLTGTVYFDDVSLVPISFPTHVAHQDKPYRYTFRQKNEDGPLWVYNVVDMPGWMQFDASAQSLSGTARIEDIGTHAVTLTVSNGIESHVETFAIRVFAAWSPLDEWQQIHGIHDLERDADNDGLTNFLEFSLGGNPLKKDRLEVAPEFVVNDSGVDISFRRNQLSVDYIIQKSVNMVDWSDEVWVDDMDGWVGDRRRLSLPVSGNTLFLKLNVRD